MDLPDDDLRFLEDATKGLRSPDARDTLELAQTDALRAVYEECREEAPRLAAAGLCASSPYLAAIITSDPRMLAEFGAFRDGFFLYALTRGYAAGYEAAQADR